jgi:hypothetical protein
MTVNTSPLSKADSTVKRGNRSPNRAYFNILERLGRGVLYRTLSDMRGDWAVTCDR